MLLYLELIDEEKAVKEYEAREAQSRLRYLDKLRLLSILDAGENQTTLIRTLSHLKTLVVHSWELVVEDLLDQAIEQVELVERALGNVPHDLSTTLRSRR